MTDADAGPSKKIPELETKLKDLQVEFDKAMPEKLQKEMKELEDQINKKIAQSTPEQKKELRELETKLLTGDPAQKAVVEADLTKLVKTIAPVEHNKLVAAAAPAQAIAKQVSETETRLANEQNQGVRTRVVYAQALWLAGDAEESRDLFKATATKFPEILKSPDFLQMLKVVKLDERDLRSKK